jgi:hypothetical protein
LQQFITDNTWDEHAVLWAHRHLVQRWLVDRARSPVWRWLRATATVRVKRWQTAEWQQPGRGWPIVIAAAVLLVLPSRQQSRLEGNRLEVK